MSGHPHRRRLRKPIDPPRRGLLAAVIAIEEQCLRVGSRLDVPGEHRLPLLDIAHCLDPLLTRAEQRPPRKVAARKSWAILHGAAAREVRP